MAHVQSQLNSSSDTSFRPLQVSSTPDRLLRFERMTVQRHWSAMKVSDVQEVYLSRRLVDKARGGPVSPEKHNHFRLRYFVP